MKKTQILYLLLSFFPEYLLETMLNPLFPFMVKSYLRNTENNVGYYTGLIGSAFFTPLFIMNTFWGSAMDKVGPKLILLLGLLVCSCCSLGLGLATSFWVAFACRFIAGMFGANSTVTKGTLGEESDPVQRAWAYSQYGAIHGVAGIIGPLLGGFLYLPSISEGSDNSTDKLLVEYPFLLVCIVPFALTFPALFIIKYLYIEANPKNFQFTTWKSQKQPKSPRPDNGYELDVIEIRDPSPIIAETSPLFASSIVEPDEFSDSPTSPVNQPINSYPKKMSAPQRLKKVFHHPAFYPIILYCCIASVNMIYLTALPLYMSGSTERGGLEFSAKDVSIPLTIISLSKLAALSTCLYRALSHFGSRKSYLFGMSLMIPSVLLIPLLGSLIRHSSNSIKVSVIGLIMIPLGIAEATSFQSVIIMITQSVPLNKLGITHGFATSAAAFARTVSPAFAGIAFEIGVTYRIPWFIFVCCGFLSLVSIYIAYHIKDRENSGGYSEIVET